ncbi:MAG: GNAT family N-acetyltransferase [Peptoniphilus sp.]|nr:GNAT family N-acetyltransferase [Peptoniphilus sp.]MDD7362844.1 GNAT family N-acetyltransferase [Bacillota bacterium]MDY6043964.1 GNAT family N-acetyltransferase [Peptoniphilus sp.]
MENFKNKEELFSKLSQYSDSYNNDYFNRDLYLEHFEELRYVDNGDFYIFIKNRDYFDTYFYLKAQNPLEVDDKLVTEIVGRDIDIVPLEKVGFKRYLTRVRFRLKEAPDYFSKRVRSIDDFDFIKDGIDSFDEISGNIHSDARIHSDIENKRIIGIQGKGFLQFSVGRFEQTIEHLYVKDAYRGEGVAREMLMHYLSNEKFKKRQTVWANEGYFVENLYLDCGFKKDGMKSIVLTR